MARDPKEVEAELSRLFDELVPLSGKADTVAGEIVRAISRIGYRYYNDGDRIGVGYGKETCNSAARYLKVKCGGEIAETVDAIWGIVSDRVYEVVLGILEKDVLDFLEAHPELKTEKNTEDFWQYLDSEEDVDDEWDEEEDDEEDEGEDY